jgi:hypothetical protein
VIIADLPAEIISLAFFVDQSQVEINELNAPSVRALKIFDIAQVTTTKTLQFRHAVLGPG